MTSKRFQKLLEQARQGDDYWIADAQADFTESLQDLMERRQINKSELARRIDSSPAYITKVMRGSSNFTLASMVRLVRALGGKLQVRVCAEEDYGQWLHVLGKRLQRSDIERQCFRPVGTSLNDTHFDRADDNEDITATA